MKNKIITFQNKAFQKKLWTIALPITLQSLLYSFLGLVDILMVSQLGEAEIAAVGLGNKVFFFNLLMMVGVSHAGGVLAAQYYGAKELSGLRRSLVTSLLISLLITLPFVLFYTLSPSTVTGLASSDIELLNYADQYLQITAYSFMFIAVVLPLETALRSAGDTKTAMNISFLVLPLNAFFNYIFIFGHWGLPAMGVEGSAWGTFLARAIQMLLLMLFIAKKRTFVIASVEEVKAALSILDIRRYLKLAIPMILHDSGWALGVFVYTLIFAMIGVQELAVMSMVSTIEQTIFALFIGVAIASGTMIGHELGAKAFDRAWQQAWTFILFVPVLAFIFVPLIIYFREPVLSFFPTLSESATTGASQVLLVLDNFTLVEAYIIALSEELIKVLMVLHRVHKKHWLKNVLPT